MIRKLVTSALLVIAVFAVPGFVSAQDEEPFTVPAGRIVVGDDTGLFTILADSSEKTMLVEEVEPGCWLRDAVWNADGSRLLYTRICGGETPTDWNAEDRTAVVMLYDMESGESTELIPNDGTYQDYAGAWHPEGEQVVIYSNRADERYNFYTVDLTSGETTQITEYENNVGRVSYDPTGRYLLYNRYVVDTDQVRWEIRALDTTNQNETRIGVGVTPHWSPDGQWIAYATETEPADVFLLPATCIYENTECNIEADAFNATYTPDISEREPLWSPDQTQLVFLRDTSPEPTIETWDIFRQDLRTGRMQNLTNTSSVKERHSAWEPITGSEPVEIGDILPVVMRVTSSTANTRSEPSTGASVVTVLNNGQIVFAQGTNPANDWYRITIPSEGVSAWIFGDLVVPVSGDPATLENVESEE